MQIEIRKSAIKDLKQISEPYRTKIHNKILESQLSHIKPSCFLV